MLSVVAIVCFSTLGVLMLSIVVLGVVKLSGFMPSVIMLIAVMLCVVMLNHYIEFCNCVSVSLVSLC
jgi:hypothetical protein